jgi:bifunctional enzyme CysN/CysC/sulfate adenylyltransferase subunit 1
LETVHIASDWNLNGFRLPVQWVNRPNNPTNPALHDFRGLSGQIAGGIVRVGQQVLALPAGIKATVKEIRTYEGPIDEAFCPQSVTVVLNEEIDISRGDMLVGMDSLPGMSTDLHARICWMHPKALRPGRKYLIKHTSRGAQAMISSIESRLDIRSFEAEPGAPELELNDIGEIKLKSSTPLVFDGYSTNRLTGSFILIEPSTNATVAAGMLLPPIDAFKPDYADFVI